MLTTETSFTTLLVGHYLQLRQDGSVVREVAPRWSVQDLSTKRSYATGVDPVEPQEWKFAREGWSVRSE